MFKLRKDRKGQFTILALFTLFLTLIVTMEMMPEIYKICYNISQICEANNDTITAFLVRLFPMSIVLVELAAIYYYAKLYIIQEE